MKAGTLYDLVRQYIPNCTITMFVTMYNEAIAKLTQDYKIDLVEETITDYPFTMDEVVKIYSVAVDDEEIARMVVK